MTMIIDEFTQKITADMLRKKEALIRAHLSQIIDIPDDLAELKGRLGRVVILNDPNEHYSIDGKVFLTLKPPKYEQTFNEETHAYTVEITQEVVQ